MEADLAHWYQIDYRDRWRGDLTLRRLKVLIQHLPADCAVNRSVGEPLHWGVEAHLLDDLRMTLVGKKAKPHPQRPKRSKRPASPDRLRALQAGRRRAAARRKAIESGEIT